MPFFPYPPLSFRGKSYLPPGEPSPSAFDVVVISGDAYVDHPAFPVAVVCRTLQSEGLKVAVISQPDWKEDSDFTCWGRPELFFAVVPGSMDSMVANYTAAKMPRSKDRLSPGGQAGLRPKRAVQVYVQKIRQLFKGSKIVVGGVEASLRRFAHYDFWEDKIRDPILHDAPADILVYGMGESILKKIADWYKKGNSETPFLAQTCIRLPHGQWKERIQGEVLLLPSVDQCRKNPAAFMQMAKLIDSSVNFNGKTVVQEHPKGDVVCFQPSIEDVSNEFPILSELKFNRRTHPAYSSEVPGLEPVQFSLQSHRGCLGTCSFCALAIHQGRFIRSKPVKDLVSEAEAFVNHPDFKGIIPDVGGPAVNMYGWHCRIGGCQNRLCIYPQVCPNLVCSIKPLLELLEKIAAVKGVRKVFVGSGLRYDLVLPSEWDLFEKLVFNHVSGQLKVAPEHFDKKVLTLMRKGQNADFASFAQKFYQSCRRCNKKMFLVPYLITAFPGSTDNDKILVEKVRQLHLAHEQIQEFTPTPSTLATAMYYSGLDLDLKPLKIVKNSSERQKSRKSLQGKRRR